MVVAVYTCDGRTYSKDALDVSIFMRLEVPYRFSWATSKTLCLGQLIALPACPFRALALNMTVSWALPRDCSPVSPLALRKLLLSLRCRRCLDPNVRARSSYDYLR